MTTAAQAHTEDAAGWPDDDTTVLASRPLRPGTDDTLLSRFGDMIWQLSPAHPDAHVTVTALDWRRYPARLVRPFKSFFHAALEQPYPASPTGQRPGKRPSVATLSYWFVDVLVFATWLDEHAIGGLSEVTAADLDAYRSHILGLGRSPARQADLLAAVRTLWLYRDRLPAACQLEVCPWDGLAAKDLVRLPPAGRENATPRIAPATMDALLAWALRMVEMLGPDIRDAWHEFHDLDAGTHPSQQIYDGLGIPDRLDLFLHHARRRGSPLPGRHDPARGTAVNGAHVLRLVGVPPDKRAGLPPRQRALLENAGLPIAADTTVGGITARIDGVPWRPGPISIRELPTLVRLLYASAFTVICYLSGMRPGEVLTLPHGCSGSDPRTGELLVHGRRGKGYDRSPLTPGQAEPDRPWVVVAPVHTAVQLLETLANFPFLFPASPIAAHTSRANTTHARSTAAINQDLEDLVTWVNTTFTHPGGTPPIPPDPTKHLHATRFRRTLAHTIVRRPRGLIAAALQYGHVHTKVTLNYAGAADISWLDDLAIERLEMVMEQMQTDARRLANGEHVSGPAATEYRARVARFHGRVVNQTRNARRLLTNSDPDVHHGDGLTCVYRAETAECRRILAGQGITPDGPQESHCRSTCSNLAYTDRSIDQLRARLGLLGAAIGDPLTPQPLRDRAHAQAQTARATIDRHVSSSPDRADQAGH
ncbi:integrase [Frankia sp. R82]|uniref:integrase n=1 Tax=Frankia sp. R82 TaxID=2950553 RepID=UPI0020437DB6|nr:integrase [Frankia sp. R82]MCM3883109.1 integrase [Frankia sp. R82]